jgi:hypothetical protein
VMDVVVVLVGEEQKDPNSALRGAGWSRYSGISAGGAAGETAPANLWWEMRDVAADRSQLLFDVRRAIRYHNARRRFFDGLHTLAAVLAVLFGTVTIFTLLVDDGGLFTAGAAVLVTAVMAIDLVVGTVGRARAHHDLARRYLAVEKQIITRLHPDSNDVNRWTADALDIEADQPPKKQVLDAIAYNELLRVYGYDQSHLLPVRWYQRLVAQWADLQAHRLYVAGLPEPEVEVSANGEEELVAAEEEKP